MKKKILIITNHSYMLYRFRKELIETLTKKQEVVLSMPFVGHEEKFQEMGVRCFDTKINRRGINPITDFRLILDYHRMLKREQPDLVITYSIKPNIYAGYLCRMMNIPYCANVQGLGTAFYKNNGLAKFVTALYRIAFRNVRTVFFENQANAAEFEKRKIISAAKMTMLPGAGINLEQYSYQPYPQNEKVHFLYLGRIMKEKGMEELFYAVEKLYRDYSDKFVLDLVGFFEEEYKAEVEKLVQKGIALFHGFQENPVPYYERTDCVVLPSYHEGMSNVLLEAATLGRPIITSDIPGCREAVEEGVTGLLCNAKDKESLYQKMKAFMAIPLEEREQMGRKGRQKMEQQFDKKKVVKMTVEKLWED